MSIFRSLRFFQVFLVISVSLFFLTSFTSIVYGDDWVYVGTHDYFSYYYNNANIKINRNSKLIDVWVKKKYTEKGIQRYINNRKDKELNINNYQNLSYTLNLFLFNYGKLKYDISTSVDYSISDAVLDSYSIPIIWRNVVPESIGDVILNKIIEDHNIQR